MRQPALLALEDGSLFYGESIGIEGQTTGEVVFNTSMTGYQEILTDPSYARQIITLTASHIGNTGTNNEDMESTGIHASGFVIRDLPDFPGVRGYGQGRSSKNIPAFRITNTVCALLRQ